MTEKQVIIDNSTAYGWRRGWESNPRIKVLQTSALPLGCSPALHRLARPGGARGWSLCLDRAAAARSPRARPAVESWDRLWAFKTSISRKVLFISTLERTHGGPGGIRTPGLPLRRRPLYPAELRAPLLRLSHGPGARASFVGSRAPGIADGLRDRMDNPRLRQDLTDDTPVDIRQTKVAARVSVRQSRVVQAELAQHLRAQIVTGGPGSRRLRRVRQSGRDASRPRPSTWCSRGCCDFFRRSCHFAHMSSGRIRRPGRS